MITEALWSKFMLAWEEQPDGEIVDQIHGALSAIAPELLAQGMEKAAEMCDADWDDEVHYQQRILAEASAIRASAAKTREGKGP